MIQNLILIKTNKERYVNHIILLFALTTISLFGFLTLDRSILFYLLGIGIFLLFYITIKDWVLTYSFNKKHTEIFLAFDDERVSAYTKKGDFSLSYKEIKEMKMKFNVLPSQLLDSQYTFIVIDNDNNEYEINVPVNEKSKLINLIENYNKKN